MSKRFIVEGPLATALHTPRVFRDEGAAKSCRKALDKAHGSDAHTNIEKTIGQLAQEALAVQNASNLCGVAQSFARCMARLIVLVPNTDAYNEHPIAILWSDKIAQLTGTQSIGHDAVMRAYIECYKLIEGV